MLGGAWAAKTPAIKIKTSGMRLMCSTVPSPPVPGLCFTVKSYTLTLNTETRKTTMKRCCDTGRRRALAFRLPAQETRGEILGRVTDPSGAVVAGASVRAIDHASNAAAAAIANASGDCRLPSLNPGLYEVSVEMPGFRRYRRERVAVRSGESASVDVKLEVGPASERIKVVAQAPLVGTASFEMAVKSEKFLDLPIPDGTP